MERRQTCICRVTAAPPKHYPEFRQYYNVQFHGVGELVLVVKDDPRVRKLPLQRLVVPNYHSIPERDGTEALRILDETSGIELVLTDLVMPGGISG
ncbi:MAG: hypothetical protein GY789_06125 [Hyphomicrobiales bacterium]|nr:hypothetical protein [Hyphomicrobiales bacterium]